VKTTLGIASYVGVTCDAGTRVPNASRVERQIVEIRHTTRTVHDELGLNDTGFAERVAGNAAPIVGGLIRPQFNIVPLASM
jgi:hypothetical protein